MLSEDFRILIMMNQCTVHGRELQNDMGHPRYWCNLISLDQLSLQL